MAELASKCSSEIEFAYGDEWSHVPPTQAKPVGQILSFTDDCM